MALSTHRQRDDAKTQAVSVAEDGVQAVANRDGMSAVEADAIRRPAAEPTTAEPPTRSELQRLPRQPTLQDSWSEVFRFKPDGRILDPRH